MERKSPRSSLTLGLGITLNLLTSPFVQLPYEVLKKPVIWGGEPRAQSKAQVDAWKQILNFFSTHLGGGQKAPSPKL